MAKTVGFGGVSFVHKKTTPTRKYEGFIRGTRMETTAVSEARAKVQMAKKYNQQNNFQPNTFQVVEDCKVI